MSDSDIDIEKQARAGNADAQIALGQRFEDSGDVKLARGWFAHAVKIGSAEAMRRLGKNLLTRMPMDGTEGIAFLRAAADGGDTEAAHLCGILAAQDEALEDRWNIAASYSAQAARGGFDLAKNEQDLLTGQGGAEALVKAATLKMTMTSPRIGIVEGFASAQVCDWFIERARPQLKRATVYDQDQGGSKIQDARNNSSVSFELTQCDLVMMAIRQRIAATTQFTLGSLEATTILHYAPGQRFEPHHDFLDPKMPGYAKALAVEGQRAATFLLYLNDDFDGGETDFPMLNFRYKGRKGDALLFFNVEPSGMPIQRTLHAGLPTTRGEKWLLSQWLRLRPIKA